MDYAEHEATLNHREIETADGRYTVIIWAQRPLSGNWLDTADSKEGLLAIRYQRVIASKQPAKRLVKL